MSEADNGAEAFDIDKINLEEPFFELIRIIQCFLEPDIGPGHRAAARDDDGD